MRRVRRLYAFLLIWEEDGGEGKKTVREFTRVAKLGKEISETQKGGPKERERPEGFKQQENERGAGILRRQKGKNINIMSERKVEGGSSEREKTALFSSGQPIAKPKNRLLKKDLDGLAEKRKERPRTRDY